MKSHAAAAAVLSLLLPPPLPAQQAASGGDYHVTGKVVMQDRSAVPLTAAVELLCNGQVRKRVRTYTNGDFSLPLGNDSSEAPDLTTPTDLFGGQKIPFDPRPSGAAVGSPSGGDAGRFELSGCELRAALPGHLSNVIALGPRRLLDKPDVGQLVLRRMADGATISANTLSAPPKARSAFESARRSLEKEKPEYANAAKDLEKAVGEYPSFAAAWNLLGRTRLALKDESGARDAFGRSMSADPKYADPYIHLARLEIEQGRWADTVNWAGQALQRAPYNADANYLNALANFQLGEFAAAEESALEVEKSFALEQYPLTYYILGATEARRGDFESAATRLRQFLQTKPDAETAESVRKILAEWAEDDRRKKGP
jgi:TolA-binding protein